MSCGDHHETPCSEVLARVYAYLDGELDQQGCGEVKQHLDECGPCLREYGLEEAVKKLVGKSCGCEPVPADLRAKVMSRIEQLCGELKAAEAVGEETPEPAAGEQSAESRAAEKQTAGKAERHPAD
ncbi:anti-sigma factor RsrA [Actinomadura rubrobrunea]|uniref:Anti-sigma factor RsrA n=1 Tax=Actinomadura rubrobrunea TaxID=115335 RepID=A0A9W6PRZ6_9ACTN|nr:anti-sigma factor RsrA [Actinomadura rubrobrunea]